MHHKVVMRRLYRCWGAQCVTFRQGHVYHFVPLSQVSYIEHMHFPLNFEQERVLVYFS